MPTYNVGRLWIELALAEQISCHQGVLVPHSDCQCTQSLFILDLQVDRLPSSITITSLSTSRRPLFIEIFLLFLDEKIFNCLHVADPYINQQKHRIVCRQIITR